MKTSLRLMFAATSATALLAACGGGGSDTPMVTLPPSVPPVDVFVSGTNVPVTATQTSAQAIAFVQTTAATPDNTGEPLVLGNATLATSETDEPAAL